MTMKPILEVKDIDKAFVGVHAVDHISFSVSRVRYMFYREKTEPEKVHC